jgi:propanol-preferring alcohol dehydrogenase
MLAMVHDRPGALLRAEERADAAPGPGELLIDVLACGVCRTDLHVVDGELPGGRLPVVPGHQIVGRVAACGAGATRFPVGTRVGVPWLAGACGACRFCLSGDENLCDAASYTGHSRDGGFAQRCAADERFVLPLPDGIPDAQAAPLLCAGLIGWRALRLAGATTGPPQRLGFFGFGASAHVLVQVARYLGHEVLAFTRPGDAAAQAFARRLGASWAVGSDEPPPAPLDAALIFAPVGALVPAALAGVRKGGTVVCAGIHMSDIPTFPYHLLWGERVLRSVANLTRRDGEEFLALAPRVPVRTEVTTYPLAQAQQALDDLRAGRFTGAAVVVP